MQITKPLYICFTYIKPYFSKEVSEEIFFHLESEINSYIQKGEVLVCGDFNARTGGLSDQTSHDSVRVNFSDCPLPQNYTPDQTKSRNQLDTKSNLHGKLLTDICKSHNLRILNGRFLGDS